jgi:hypothetical protein
MYLCARGVVVACDRSCICVLGESLLLMSRHVMCARGIDVACERSCICLLEESLFLVSGHVFVC